MSFGQTPLSTTPLGTNQFPASAVAVPGTANGDFTALEGGPTGTDSNGNKTAPASIYVKDGNDVTVGTTTQTKATDGTGTSWSVIQLLKGIFDKLLGNVAVTEASAAAAKTDLDTLVANTADLLADGDQLATIQTNTANIPAKGTAVMTGSTPVTIATNDTVFAELLLDTDNLASSLTQQTNLNTVLGATGDAAVTGDTAGSLSAKVRGWSKMLFDMWDSTNHLLQVKVMNGNANGQATMSNSSPVVLASDEIVPIKSSRTEVIGNAAANVTSTSTDLITAMDVTGYSFAVLQLTGTWSMTLQAAQCNDNATFLQTQLINAQTFVSNTALVSNFSANGLYIIPISGRYLRVRPSTWNSNASCVATLELYTTLPPYLVAAMGTYASLSPQTSGGATVFHLVSAGSTNLTNLKSSIGQVYSWNIENTNAAWRYVKFHNTSGSPTAGSGVVRTVGVPPNGLSVFHTTLGIPFATGIAISTVTGAADSDTTAVAASDLIIDIDFK